jgi:hypothetical protein
MSKRRFTLKIKVSREFLGPESVNRLERRNTSLWQIQWPQDLFTGEQAPENRPLRFSGLFLFFGFVVGFGDEFFDLFKIFDDQPGLGETERKRILIGVVSLEHDYRLAFEFCSFYRHNTPSWRRPPGNALMHLS